MPRILFVTTKIGFGHIKVSNTLAQSCKNILSECSVKIVAYFDFFPPQFSFFINFLYFYALKLFPKVFGYIYISQKKYKGKGIDFWYRIFGTRYASVIRSYMPDIVIITQGLACQWLARLKRNGLISCPLVAVLTDFIVHPFWVANEINLYIVANQDMKKDLISRGISEDIIKVTGIPIDPRFNILYDRDLIMKKYKINKNNIVALIMGGGWGLGSINEIVKQIDFMDLNLELLIVCGKNRRLFRKIKNAKFRLPVHVYGKVDNMSELMSASDFIITKAGGVTVSELLAKGLPAIIWDVIPGQEEANAAYLVENGAAVLSSDIQSMKNSINTLVLFSNDRDRMRECSEKLAMLDSTYKAVRYIEYFLSSNK